MTFGAWLYSGDSLSFAEISITSDEFGGTTYFDQTVNFSQGSCSQNGFGFTVCQETASFSSVDMDAGTYWVNLQNASVPSGDPVYWDENSGPSMASENSIGTIPSESFTLEGGGGGRSCYQSRGNLQIIHDFTQQEVGVYGALEGVAIDQAGNLYGTTTDSFGNENAGFAYKLADLGGWLLDPLFNFVAGDDGSQPGGVIVGPNGSLYGSAQGGIQNCGTDGSQYCGLVFNLRPKPTACLTALCGWTENVPYRFTSESDGSGKINVSAFDQQGNLYGTTTTGGTNDLGTVFELTPSTGGSWTKTTLYSFLGSDFGFNPTQVLVGSDGNLYGLANGGTFFNGVVFQLTPSGGQWTETLIHVFGSENGHSYQSQYLVQDSAGNLYGISTSQDINAFSAIFALQKTSSGWYFNEMTVEHNCSSNFPGDDVLTNLAVDAAGNLYGTGGGFAGPLSGSKKYPGEEGCSFNYIFKASYASGTWNYQDLYYRDNVIFSTGGSLALDASGNLYGTTAGCGANGYGTVWQLSP